MSLLDLLFCCFKWYRRKTGGIWYQYKERVPADEYSYPLKRWTNEKQGPGVEVTAIEDYTKKRSSKKEKQGSASV